MKTTERTSGDQVNETSISITIGIARKNVENLYLYVGLMRIFISP